MHKRVARYKAVLFDLDGTLLDTAPDFTTATNVLLAKKNLPQTTEEKIRPLISDGSAGIISSIFMMDKSSQIFEKTRKELLVAYKKHLADNTRLFKGLDKLLLELENNNIPWGVVTNKPELYTKAIFNQLKMKWHPDVTVCPDHIKKIKPDPEAVLLACSQLGVKAKDTVFIGDHHRDIKAGISAGTSTIAAAYGYIDDHSALSDWQADHIVMRSEDLINLIFYPQ